MPNVDKIFFFKNLRTTLWLLLLHASTSTHLETCIIHSHQNIEITERREWSHKVQTLTTQIWFYDIWYLMLIFSNCWHYGPLFSGCYNPWTWLANRIHSVEFLLKSSFKQNDLHKLLHGYLYDW